MAISDAEVLEQIGALWRVLSGHPRRDLYGPAEFWDAVGHRHIELIRKHGFGTFKRTVNFEYHQESIADPKIRSLLSVLLRRGRLPYGPFLTRIDRTDLPNIEWFDLTAYGVFLGLLWQYACLEDRLGCLRTCEEPTFGEPLPVAYQGRLISQDLATSSIELNRIASHVELANVRRVAEIGAGYGRLAYVVRSRFPRVEYCIFDVPPALVIAENYLAVTLGEDAVQRCRLQDDVGTGGPGKIGIFLPHQLERFPERYFDLVINISSFDEMSGEQVKNYFSLIDRKSSGWLYIKGHAKAPPWCGMSGGGITELPYPPTWKLVHEERDPFIAAFRERIYAVGAAAARGGAETSVVADGAPWNG